MCKECDWTSTLAEIEGMLNDDDHRWAWAYDTLTGISNTITKTGHATEGQKRAVENIQRKCR